MDFWVVIFKSLERTLSGDWFHQLVKSSAEGSSDGGQTKRGDVAYSSDYNLRERGVNAFNHL